MGRPSCSREEYIDIFRSVGAEEAARRLGISVRQAHRRRADIERDLGITLLSPSSTTRVPVIEYPHRLKDKVHDGVILVGSDMHYRPGLITTAHRGLVKFAKTLKPKIVVANGDVMDFPTISRHAPIGWEKHPKVSEEIETAVERMGELEMAYPKARRVWSLGNHDARFETRLATQAPEYANVHGMHLKDTFPHWEPCWSIWINEEVVIKHRFKGGIHATHNNTMWAGKTVVTGHLHSLKVTPFSDYNGTRWGVDTGTLAEPYGPAFVDYTEDGPKNWRSGFVVLTFRGGRLMWPEIASVVEEGVIDFRGEAISV